MTDPLDPTSRALTAEAIDSLLLDTEPYLSCADCFELLDRYVDRRSRDPEYHDALMETHLAGCGACAEEAEALAELLDHDAR